MLLAMLWAAIGLNAQIVLLSEDFDNTSTDSIPANWNNSDYLAGSSPSSTIMNYMWKVSDGGRGTSRCATLTAEHAYVQKARLKSPVINLPALKDAYVSFALRNSSEYPSDGSFNLYVSTDGGATYSSNILASNINTGANWQTYTFALDAYRGQSVRLVFEGSSSGSASTTYLYFLDDVVVAEKPTCQPPVGLYVQGLTSTSVNLNWLLDDRFGAAPDQYSITLKDASGNVVLYDGAYSNAIQGYSFSNLSPNTTYVASVRSNCQATSYQGFSDSISISFTTLPLAINPPYYQDFNSIGMLPNGFYHQNVSINMLPNYAYGNVGNSLRLTTTSQTPAYIAFPLVNLRGGDIEMDFVIRREAAISQSVGAIPFKVGYLTDPSDFDGTFFPIYTGTLDGDAQWKNIRFQRSLPQDQITPLMPCILIDAAFNTSVYVDNFSAHAVPSCIRPDSLTVASITSTSATLDWTSTNTTIIIRARNLATSTIATIASTQHPYTLSNLSPQTDYEISIAALCATTDTSDFTLPVTIKTACAAATTPLINEGFETTIPDCWSTGWFNHPQGVTYKDAPFAISAAQKHMGIKSLSLERQPAGTISYISTYALPFDVAGKYDLHLSVSRENTPAYANEGITLWITNTPGDTTGGTRLGRINRHYQSEPAETSTGWHEYTYNIPIQGTQHITIAGHSDNGGPVYIDDLRIAVAPTCRKVSAIAGDTLSASSYRITWAAGGSESQWMVHYTLTGGATLITDTTITTATPALTISNLARATQYSLSGSIRALCATNDTSEAMPFAFQFSTPDTTVTPPSCLALEGFATVTDITAGSARITLSDITAITGWTYAYGPAGNAVTTMTTTDTTGGSLVVTGLAPATQYDLYVRRSCGNGDYGEWSAPVRFSTLSIPAAMPYGCDFENTAENAQWIFADGDGTTTFVIGSNASAVHGGASALYVSKDNGTTYEYQHGDTKCFAYRTLHFDSKGYQIGFNWKATGGEAGSDFGRVMLVPVTTPIVGGTGTDYPLDAIFIDPDDKTSLCLTTGDIFGWNTVSRYIDMSGRSGDYNLVVMWTNDMASGVLSTPLSIDDISISELSCIPPSSVIVSNLSSTGADLTFAAYAASQWEVIIDTLPVNLSDLPASPFYRATVQTNPLSLNSLAPNTDYYYTVRSICPNGDTSTWRESASFRTFCITASVPYTEGFEIVASDRCWTSLTTASGSAGSIIRSTSVAHDGYSSLLVSATSAVSPEFDVDSLARYMISGWAMSATDSATLGIGVIVDPDDVSTYEQISTVSLTEGGRWVEFAAYFDLLNTPAYSDFNGAKHIVLSTGSSNIFIDNISVEERPSCPKPTSPAITNITDTSFTISFVDNATASSWIVYTNGVPHHTNTTTATITGLRSATDYAVRVAAICSATDTSATADCGIVHTDCGVTALPYRQSFETLLPDDTQIAQIDPLCWLYLNASTTYPYQPSFCANTAKYTDGFKSLQLVSKKNVSLYMIMPLFEAVQNPLKVSFDIKYYNTTKCGVVKVGYLTDVTSQETFVEVGSTVRQTPWTRYDIVVPSLPAGARLALKYDNDASYGVNSNYIAYIDNLVVSEVRPCSDPSAAQVSNITATTAQVSFADADEEHYEWQYVLGTSTTDPDLATPVAVYNYSFNLTSLQPATDYYLYIRTMCESDGASNWVLTRFSTLCQPYAVSANTPFADSFEDVAMDDHLAGCYTVTDIYDNYYPRGWENRVFPADVYLDSRTGTHCLQLSNQVSYAPEGQSAFRTFHLEAGNIYRASVYYRYTAVGNRASLVFGTDASNLDVIDYADCEGCSGVTTTGSIYYYDYHSCWQQLTADIPITQTGDYYIGIRAERSPGRAGAFYMYFDDFSVVQLEGCLPTQPTVDSVSAYSAFFHIADTVSAHQYEYAVLHDLDTIITPTLLSGIADSCSSLLPATNYRLLVRQRCAVGIYSEWTAADFTTLCAPVNTFPMTQGFESSTFPPACWTQLSYGTVNHIWATTANADYVHSGSRAASVIRMNAGAKVALVTGELNLTSPYGYYVRFSMYRSNTGADKVDEALHLLYSTVPLNSASIAEANQIAVINRNVQLPPVEPDNISRYYDYEYEIPAGVTGSVWVAFDFHCQYGGAIFIDDVEITPMPSCVAPRQAPVVASRTMTTATLSVAMNGKPQAEVAYAAYTAPDSVLGTVLTTNGTAVVSGLSASTRYIFCYRYVCAQGDTSDWSPVTMASTLSTDCSEPLNLRICGITNAHSATVTWDYAPLALGYEYVLTKGGVVVDSALTTADTLRFANLDMSTAYTLRLRTICTEGITDWVSLGFSTTFTTFAMPFVCGFEDNVQNLGWQLRNVQSGANAFAIGQGTSRNGISSLYITSDGSTYNYDISATSGADAEALLEMPAGSYYVEYDWLCTGESNYDFGRVFLIPSSIQLNDIRVLLFNQTLPAGAISLDNNATLNLQTEWQHYTGIVNIPSDALYKLVVLFACDSRGGQQPPLAIDNIHIQPLLCQPVASVTIPTVNSNDAVAVVAKSSSDVAVEYGYTVYDEADSVRTWLATDNGAISDTLHLTSLQPNTTYWLYVRHACSADSLSPIVRRSFTTALPSVAVPFVCSFEAGEPSLAKWHTTTGGAANYFVMGSSAASAGINSLYVTNDGINHYYDTASLSWSYAYVPVAVRSGIVGVSYDWLCQGERSKDYARIFFAPSSTVLAGNVAMDGVTATSLPAGFIPLDGGKALSLSSGWVSATAEHAFANDNTYLLVVAWHNDAAGGANAPVAIDNIRIYEVSCPMLSLADVSVSTTTESITLSSGTNAFDYTLASDASFSDVLSYGLSFNGSTTISWLNPSTYYYLRLRRICGVGDTSAAFLLAVRTDCGVRTLYPYHEGFESMQAGTTARDQMLDDCWSVDSRYAGSYHYVNNSTRHSGTNSFTIFNGNSADSYQTFGLLTVDTLASKRLSVWYRNHSGTASTYALLQVGYLSDPADSSSFVLLATAPFNNSGYTEFIYDYPDTTPANARPAFRAMGTHYLYIDDIRLSRIVEGDTHYETLCHNSPFSGYGFSCPAGSLGDGDTTLVRVQRSDVIGTADTIVSVNIHIFPEFLMQYNDTVCAGHPYVSGLWNIPNPVTQVYRYTWQGYETASGCDSTVYLDLYVQPLHFDIYDTICQGSSRLFDGRYLTASGEYPAYSINRFGCNDTTLLHLFVVLAADTLSATICQGNGYLFHGTTYTATGFYSVQTTGTRGCSVTHYLNLTVLAADSFITVSFCKGGSVYVVDTTITTAGSYSIVRPNGSGCHLTYHVTATERPVVTGYISDYACEGHAFTGYGITGLVVTHDTVVYVNGRTWDAECDSVTEVSLTYTPIAYGSESVSINSGESYLWNDNSYSKAGTYTDTLVSVVTGCDSIATLHLTVISVGVDNVYDISVDIVPNPVGVGSAAFIYGDYGEISTVELLDGFGKLIDTFVPSSYPIQLPAITSSGLYFIRLTISNGIVVVEKLIVR